MKTIHVDFSSRNGRIKPMNAVNNGPTGMSERGTSNFLDYKALEIPYARNHDASFYYGYGGDLDDFFDFYFGGGRSNNGGNAA